MNTNIYGTTLIHPKTGYVVGLIDYLDPTHSAATECETIEDARSAVRELLADYTTSQIVVLGSNLSEYAIHADHDLADIAFELMF
jgi:hypothetical protein